MRFPFARAIRDARLTLRLTQAELGMRLGLKGRAVYRWEAGRSAPSRRHRRALVVAVRAVSPELAARLQTTFNQVEASKRGEAQMLPPAPPPKPNMQALELALFAMADELDLAPRRLRSAAAKLLARVADAGFGVREAHAQLETWITSSQPVQAAP